MSYTTVEGRQQVLSELGAAIDHIAVSLASLGEAYEQLDENSADTLEAQLFRPVQLAYGRAKRTHAQFAARSGLPSRVFETASPGLQSQTVTQLIERAADAAMDADQAIADLQDSMLPIEVGDTELRSGLTQARESLGTGPSSCPRVRADRRALSLRRWRAGLVVPLALAALATGTGTAQAKPRSAFVAHGSVEQVYATGLRAGRRVTLVSRAGTVVARRAADSLGGVLFRHVAPGSGYAVRQFTSTGMVQSKRLTVEPDHSAPPNTRGYDQRLPRGGYGYLTTRDQTKLAIDVHLPGGKGPYPTLIEYSGYGYADPAGAEKAIGPIATVLGFAVVDVNMRGTGCSGGAYDYFEPLQNLDGYDVIETVARQPWVLHHTVGMMGISFGAISQPFVAATDPPHLAAIAPLSVIDNTATTLYPGGILNTGFALTWGQERVHDAEPATATTGQAWAYTRIKAGDQTCQANQALHGEAANLIAILRANNHYVPSVADPLAPITFVNKIHVPTYLACQWTDEQTGGHCADLAEHFTGTRRKWFTFTNGAHIDSIDPATFNRWYDFLELYVARRAPHLSPTVRALAPTIYSAAMGVPNLTLPPDPIQSIPSYAGALAAFQRLQSIRVLFDNGAGSATARAPYPGFQHSFSRWPIPGTQARSWYLGSAGALGAGPPGTAGADRFVWNQHALPATDFSGDTSGGPGGLWTTTPVYHWEQNPTGTAASYLTRRLQLEHRGDRRRRRPSVAQDHGSERRSAGDDLRGPARWQGDVRSGRLAARRRAQARRGQEHAVGPGAEPPRRRRRTAAAGAVHRADGPAVLRGPRLPPRLADPPDRRGAGRRAADLGVRRDPAAPHRRR